MSKVNEDERWFDVLAGKAEPTNADERQAASLRHYFELREEQEAQPDPAALKRMENLLMARLAARQSAQQEVPISQRLWKRFSAWLMPAGGGHPERYAMVAAVALAVVAVPVVLHQGAPEDGSQPEMKGGQSSASGEVLVTTAEPEREARALLTVLQQNGLAGALVAEGSDQLVKAQIPRERLGQVGPALAGMGLAVPVDGQLQVRFRKAP